MRIILLPVDAAPFSENQQRTEICFPMDSQTALKIGLD
jgi:hypothetical protein